MLCKKAVSDVFLHSVCRKLTWQSLAELGVRDNFRDNATIQHLQWGRKWGINSVNLLNLTYPSHPPTHEEVAPTHRLIIYPDRQSISSLLENWTFCCPVLGSRQCTSAYTETGDPARRPGIPQPWHWHSTARQGSVRFNLKEALPLSLFPSRCIYSLIGVLCYIYGQCFYKTFSHGSANSKEKNIHLQNIKSQTIYRTKPGLIYCSEPSIVILRAWLGKYICIVK